jgi:hypothetical protein
MMMCLGAILRRLGPKIENNLYPGGRVKFEGAPDHSAISKESIIEFLFVLFNDFQ